MVRAGRDAPMVKAMLVPEATPADADIPPTHRAFVSYCNAVMEAWDGPAALAMYDGRWVMGGMDRNGLRPMRYTITNDGLLIAGSEAGMVRLEDSRIIERGRLGPGQMLAVDLVEGRLYHDREIKQVLASKQPYQDWTKRIKVIDGLIRAGGEDTGASMPREELRRRQVAMNITMEDLELILHPMVEDAKEAVGSMGDDTPIAILSDLNRPLHHFFRQNFSQVTNPPIDSLRERRVWELRTRLGNLGNILDEDASQCDLLQLDSPVLTNAEYEAMRAYMGATAAEIDCTFDREGGEQGLRDALRRVCREAEDAVRGGATHIVLTDQHVGPDRVAIQMILATGAVHTHLIRQSLRTFTSLNVRSMECVDVHHFAVLIGVGATTVNAYLAQEAIADRQRRGLFGDLSLDACMKRYRQAVDDGLLKIMSKMGISVISSYRGVDRQRRHPADRRLLPLPPGAGASCLGRADDPHAAAGRGDRQLLAVPQILRHDPAPGAGGAARPAGLRAGARVGLDRRGREHHRDPQALHHPRHVARRAEPGGARHAERRHEPDRRPVRQRRGRRGPGPVPAGQEWRQLELRDQAGRLGPLRRHRGIPEPGA
jgi:glutamate synthase (NADPH/NADH) large chain